jgi:Mg-chelatase subunit ChlI
MKFKHRDGEEAEGEKVSVSTHLKPEVNSEGVFEIDKAELERRGVDPEAARSRLSEAGHTDLETEYQGSEESGDVSDSDSGSESSESSESESEDEEAEEESQEEAEEEPEEEGDEAATKTDLMNLKKDQLVTMAESVEDVDPDQNKEPLAEELAGQVVLEGEE